MIWGEVAEEFSDFKSIFEVFGKNKSLLLFMGINSFNWESCAISPLSSNS